MLDLGKSPLCQTVLSDAEVDRVEQFYPLRLYLCRACGLVQLNALCDRSEIFNDDYPYYASYSVSWVEHAKQFCAMITSRLRLGEHDSVVEIASNDGYLLQHFPPLGVRRILGVEPSSGPARRAIDAGIETIIGFFGEALAATIVEERGPARLIVGNNVLAHVPDLRDFVGGVRTLLAPDGVATFEFPHLMQMVDNTQFDTIYHEHFSYLCAGSVDVLAKQHGLALIDVEKLPTHGGSLRVYLSHDGHADRSERVDELIALESARGLNQLDYYKGFRNRVERVKSDLLSFLIEAKSAGRSVAGYGMPGKANTLLNYCGIGPEYVPYTVDRNPAKQGRYSPGRHIPIFQVDAIFDKKPDYVLIFPWNLRDEIMSQMSAIRDWGGRFVIPIPSLEIVAPN